jgi:hypothetical protein
MVIGHFEFESMEVMMNVDNSTCSCSPLLATMENSIAVHKQTIPTFDHASSQENR